VGGGTTIKGVNLWRAVGGRRRFGKEKLCQVHLTGVPGARKGENLPSARAAKTKKKKQEKSLGLENLEESEVNLP